jgi:putative membrane protein
MKMLAKTSLVLIGAAIGIFAASDTPMKDQKFAKAAATGGMAEVKLGQLAVEKADSSKVKDFGKRMVADHSKANEKLKSIAGEKSISLPSDVSAKDKALYDRLSAMSGANFDKAYMSAMLKDHKTAVADFEQEANSGSDEKIKSFASDTLPTLKEHLQMATDVAQSVGAR